MLMKFGFLTKYRDFLARILTRQHDCADFISVASICYLLAFRSHNLKAAGSNPAPATTKIISEQASPRFRCSRGGAGYHPFARVKSIKAENSKPAYVALYKSFSFNRGVTKSRNARSFCGRIVPPIWIRLTGMGVDSNSLRMVIILSSGKPAT